MPFLTNNLLKSFLKFIYASLSLPFGKYKLYVSFIFHLDIYKESTEDLSKLLDFCLENNIDVYIPIKSNNSPVRDGYDYSHIDKIREILERYETTRYDLTNISYNNSKEIEKSINEATKPIIRDINIKRLLD